ncbi:hypothetical protein HBH56_081960 [Parastagonospora nodorum]|uniref:BTB domain-containing protein n=2 Tax=Phaeosphaeria nodorum (strain SN15 / ATCC MYA-4574 / FGSC 10173) TaxID=321614 RepID=A0A7U2F0T8_PHANO|nr:hypothetical protein HBH56_081960 [Parastagonospora nodorum]QRC96626.1 hypothetical protein JI435_015240 [Parastagonospora nodorum SN15]KAH3929770.1 hypothetical protein HBH54_119880 [Parastagonospora nodorum]KAH4138042.1 hypothetical protein HBH45_113600 [Parastagonospora nodorum]KAH4150740.1 hypothetical protein HBH44_174660 [Parastagonospora nodorum]
MTSTAPEKQLHELLSRSMVDIYVGPENTHWILHEKLLCHYSPFFRRIFYAKNSNTTSFGLPEEEDAPFKTFVGWLYSSSLPVPREEADLGLLFDLYLMAEKFMIPNLVADVLQVVREWYKYSDTYPGLRRVQYVYANTEEGSPMRHMLVHAVARLMVIEKGIPAHWDKALKKNGQLAVDIIRAIQDWRLDEDVVPDARDEPEDAEELVDVEAETEKLDQEVEAEIEGGEVEEGEDDSEATVVDSPTTQKRNESAEKEKTGKTADVKGKGNDLVKDFKKFSLTEVPNGLAGVDYGTLRA